MDDGATDIGGIVAYLRIESGDWEAKLAEAQRQAEALNRVNPNIRITTNGAELATQLGALRSELDELKARHITVTTDLAQTRAELATLREEFRRQGEQAGGAFASKVQETIRAGLAAIPKVELDANAAPADVKLQELRAQMDELGKKKIGVDVTAADALAKLKLLQKELDKLNRNSKDNVRIRVDTAEASLKIAALRAEIDTLGATGGIGNAIMGKGSDLAGQLSVPYKLISLIALAASLAGPALGAATGGAVELAGAAGAAALAYKGLQDQEARQTAIGGAVQSSIRGIGGELHKLEGIAAVSAEPGIVGALRQIKGFMPELEGTTSTLATHLGAALNIGAGGTVTALRVMQPLLAEGGDLVQHLAQKFATFAASPQFAQFIAYAQRELPVVAQDLGDIVVAAVKLGVALEPAGEKILGVADDIAKGVGYAADAVHFLTGIDLTKGSKAQKAAAAAAAAAMQVASDKAAAQAAAEAALQSALDRTRAHFGLTAAQADTYTSVLGITAKQVADGTVSQAGYARVLAEVANAERTATGTTSDYLAAVSTFAQSAGSAADRAALIGAALKAANGDALSYSATMVTAATANQGFVTAFDDARTAASKAHVAFDAANTGVVDLTTGSLNYKNAAAGPLISGLQAMQTAAMAAAGATYQHEVATRGAAAASTAAVDVYRGQTAGALVDEAKQLGLTGGQAKALADRYFALPKDITTKIKAVGQDPVVQVLNRIGQQLSYLTRHAWMPTVGVNDQASSKIIGVSRLLGGLQDRTFTITTIEKHADGTVTVGTAKAQKQATGGLVRGPGTGTSDSVPFRNASTGTEDDLSNGEFIETAKATARNRAALAAANAGATLAVVQPGRPMMRQAIANSGFVGVTAPAAPKSGSSSSGGSSSKPKNVPTEYDGITYGSATAAHNAHLRALRSAADKAEKARAKDANKVETMTDTAGGGSVIGVANYLKGQAGKAKAASKLLAAAVDDGFKLKGVQAELTKLKASLASLKQDRDQLASSTTNALTSKIDPSQYGSASDLIAAYTNRTGVNQHMQNEETVLTRKGINKNLLAQLVANGDSVGLASLAGSSKSVIAQTNKAYSAYVNSAKNTGAVAGRDVYGARIDATTKAIAKDNQRAARLENAVVHLLAAVVHSTNQAAEVTLDGHVIAKSVIKSKEFQGILDNLGHLIREG